MIIHSHEVEYMKEKIIKINITLATIFILVACNNQFVYYPEVYSYIPNTQNKDSEIKLEVEEKQDTTLIKDNEDDIVYQEEVSTSENPSDLSVEYTYLLPSTVQISEYGRQVAEEFLSGMTSVFTDVLHEQTIWDGEKHIATGRFWNWDAESQQIATTDEMAEINYRPPNYTGEWGFFDKQGNRIYDAPWIYAHRGEGWSEYFYASSFKLFDFDNDGIPEIFIHFNQTVLEAGYFGFYQIFRYIDGEYRMLEIKSFVNGEESPLPWIGRFHELFLDDSGRIITFVNSDYHDTFRYEHLVLTDEYAELHFITGLGYSFEEWEVWHKYHWESWMNTPYNRSRIDGWMYNNPTIFETDIPLTIIQPLTSLQEEIIASILERIN